MATFGAGTFGGGTFGNPGGEAPPPLPDFAGTGTLDDPFIITQNVHEVLVSASVWNRGELASANPITQHQGQSQHPVLWFRYDPASTSEIVSITSTPGEADRWIEVWQGPDAGTLTYLAGDDDSGGNLNFLLQNVATTGELVWLRIGTWDYGQYASDATLSWTIAGTLAGGTETEVELTFALDLDLLGEPLAAMPGAVEPFTLDFDLLGDPKLSTAVDYEAIQVPRTEGASPTSLTLTLKGDYELTPAEDLEALVVPRGISHVKVTVPEPAIIMGRPVVPRYWFKNATSVALRIGSGAIRVEAEPAPPAPEPGDMRWTAAVGTPAENDWLENWPDVNGGPSWRSVYPYRPRLRVHKAYGLKGSSQNYKALLFNPDWVEHMWLDLGENMPQPYTVIIAGMIVSYRGLNQGNFLLDAGKGQAAGSANTTTVRVDKTTNDGLSYRSLLLTNRGGSVIMTRKNLDDGVWAQVKVPGTTKPRVWAGVYNGASSYVASMDAAGQHTRKGTTDAFSVRHLVTGRAQGHLSDNWASHFLMFEMRIKRRALTPEQLKAEYGQLATLYKFAKY